MYKNNDPPLQEENIFLSQNTIPKLDDTDQQSCEGTITLQECESVIKKFKKNKSPGNDGIPVEFYLEFWNEIKQPLINCYNYSFENGLLTTSQRQAIISLISKPGKDRTHIENWRPISLLNIDYKIMTKCLSERLAKIIDKIVHQSQFGFIKGRNINDALRTILDIVEYTDMENKPGILLALDFQKAFDSLSWDYLFKTLKAYNFGIDYLTWVKLCYTDISSCVTNYKYASPYFALQRGVRQGDPLSLYLFILALETLSMKIREDEHINGITVGDKAIKVITFADDTTAFAKNERGAKKMFRYIQYFEKLAGLKLNKSKSDGFWLGANKNSNFKPLGIAWKTCIKILGINISYNKQEAIKLNFQTKLIKIKQILSIWAQRDLTIYGKILLIKSFALSQILHISSILPVPVKFISDLEEIVYNFLWNGKQHKVKKHVIIQKYENGGQNMISIQDMITGQRLTWIQKYLRRNNSYWKDTMESILNIDYLDIFLQSNFCIPHRITEFYRTVLQCWKNTRNDNIKSSEVIKEQYIWYNQHIKFNPNKRYMHAYIDKGILKIKDIVNGNGSFKNIDQMMMEYTIDPNSFLFFQSIVNAIPKHWRSILNSNNVTGQTNENEQYEWEYDITNTTIKNIYNQMIIKKKDISKANLKYSAIFNITDEQWKAYYKMYQKINVLNKAKEVQYKIVHDYVATNKLLYKMNKIDSPRCNFCELYTQDTCHLFSECLEIKNFWFAINNWLQTNYNEVLNLTPKSILFGQLDSSEIQKKINMYAKLFIYKCKYKNNIPHFETFQAWIIRYINY